MRFVHDRQSVWESLAAATCLIFSAACATLRPVGLDELRGPNPPSSAHVTLTDHSTLDLDAPKLVGDTLVGMISGVRWPLLLSQTTAIEVREAAPERMAELVWGGLGVAFALLVIETTKSPQPSGPCVAALCPNGVRCCGPLAAHSR